MAPLAVLALWLTGCVTVSTGGAQSGAQSAAISPNGIGNATRPAPAAAPAPRSSTEAIVGAPCIVPRVTAGTYPPGTPPGWTLPLYPDRGRAERVPGCAGLAFRVAPDGSVTDLRVAVESPPGYGFGEAARVAMARARYNAALAGPRTYYYLMRFML